MQLNVLPILQSTVNISILEKKEERIIYTVPENSRCTIQPMSHGSTGLFVLPHSCDVTQKNPDLSH